MKNRGIDKDYLYTKKNSDNNKTVANFILKIIWKT